MYEKCLYRGVWVKNYLIKITSGLILFSSDLRSRRDGSRGFGSMSQFVIM